MLGTAVPEGETAYVLRTKTMHGIVKEVVIINAVTGEQYDAADELCPLVSVGTVFNAENIWVNIQPNDETYRISYQVRRNSLYHVDGNGDGDGDGDGKSCVLK